MACFSNHICCVLYTYSDDDAGLNLMEAEERELLSRKYIEGWPVRDISAATGMSEKAVDSKLVRARQKLRSIMVNRRSLR